MNTPVIVAAIVTLAVLGVGAAATDVGPWYRDLRKPRWNPPNWVFGPAWTLILGCAAWAGVIAWSRASAPGAKSLILGLYGVNIVLHLLWSPLFFNLRRPDWALIEVPFLWASVLALILAISPLSAFGAWLLAPYLLWVSFAAVLNAVIVRLNYPFTASTAVSRAKS
jgi:tryptophan-rich sensory protein